MKGFDGQWYDLHKTKKKKRFGIGIGIDVQCPRGLEWGIVIDFELSSTGDTAL